jgi:hypothetical protein
VIGAVVVGGAVAGALAPSCALTFSPGDYVGVGRGDAAGERYVAADGRPGPAGANLYVLAGARDPTVDIAGVPTDMSDVWLGSIDAKGNVHGWTYAQPAPYRGAAYPFTVIDDRLYVVGYPNGIRSVEFADFKSGLNATWRGVKVDKPPYSDGYAEVFAGSSLLGLGGGAQVPADGGGSELRRDDGVYVIHFDATGAFQPSVKSSTTLPAPLRYMSMLAYKTFVYMIGGEGEAGSLVHVARSDPTAGVAPFVATTEIVNPVTTQSYSPPGPILCAADGRFWIIGGTNTDIVLGSAINEGDGSLGPWKAETKLPGPLRDAGCFILGGALYLVGGIGPTSRTDSILRAPINADGSLGDWDANTGDKLPAPRSSIVAIPY